MRISFAVATAALCATVAHAQAQAGHHHHEKRLLDNLGLATVNAQLDSVLANGNKGLLNQVLSVLGLEGNGCTSENTELQAVERKDGAVVVRVQGECEGLQDPVTIPILNL